MSCVDVRAELRKRKIPFGKMTPTYVLRKKLAKIVDEEEDKEDVVLASADQNLEYIYISITYTHTHTQSTPRYEHCTSHLTTWREEKQRDKARRTQNEHPQLR